VVLPLVRLSRPWQPHSPLPQVERQQLLLQFLRRLQVLLRRVFQRLLQEHRFLALMPPAQPASVQLLDCFPVLLELGLREVRLGMH
jgi:hypothetical protein